MNTVVRKTFWLTVAVALALGSAGVLMAQGSGQSQQQKPPSPPTPPGQGQQGQEKPPGEAAAPPAPPVNPEEEKAYKAFFDAKGTAESQISLGEDFLKKFPESRYTGSVYARLAFAYMKGGDLAKVAAAGQKALELNNENVDVLALMSMVIARRVDPSQLAADQQLTRAETYGKQAITLIPNLPKPTEMTDDAFAKAKNETLSMAHSGLGMVYFHRSRYADSVAEYTQATSLAAQPDPADFFMLGAALQNSKKFTDAADAFGKCAAIPWGWQSNCKQQQDAMKKAAAAQPKP